MVGTVTGGRPPMMPGFGATLGSAEIESIVSYVRTELG